MDQAVIHTPDLKIRPEVLERATWCADFLAQWGRYQINNNHEGCENWINVKVGPECAVRLVVRKFEKQWHCKRIHLFLPRWLAGHNGYVVTTQETFLIGLNSYYDVVSQLALPGCERLVLPGIGRGNTSYWNSIEFAIHIADPRQRIIRAFGDASHARIRKATAIYPGQSVTLGGTHLRIKAYDKRRTLRGRFDATIEEPITRLEVEWDGPELRSVISRGRPRTGVLTSEPDFVRSFSLATLYAAFRHTIGEVRGVFLPNESVGDHSYIAVLLAHISKIKGIPLWELQQVAHLTGVRSEKSIRKQFKEAREVLELLSETPFENCFPDVLPIHQPYFHCDHEEPLVLLAGTPVRQEIRDVYHDANCYESTFWRPGGMYRRDSRSLSECERLAAMVCNENAASSLEQGWLRP